MTSIIDEREKTHGPFLVVAGKAQQIKDAMRGGANWDMMDDIQREALEMIASKIGRILAGNHDETDHWRDIAGYAALIERWLTSCTVSVSGPTPHPAARSPETPSPVPPTFVVKGTAKQP